MTHKTLIDSWNRFAGKKTNKWKKKWFKFIRTNQTHLPNHRKNFLESILERTRSENIKNLRCSSIFQKEAAIVICVNIKTCTFFVFFFCLSVFFLFFYMFLITFYCPISISVYTFTFHESLLLAYNHS